MEMDPKVVEDALVRLRKIQGQVGGIARMVEDGRECRDVVRQVSAAVKALEQVGFKLIASGLRYCVTDEQAARRDGYSEADFEKLFLQLA